MPWPTPMQRSAPRATAEAAIETRDRFVSIAAHELRTPLTSLIGYTHLVRTGMAQGKGGLERMAELIDRQAQRLNTLIDQLLDVSRLQQGQFALACSPVDLAALITQVVDEVRITLAEMTPQRIDLHRPNTTVMIVGDANRLEQVILNLLSNAVKYSPRGGPVSVRVRHTATEAVVEVQDHGIGIPVDARACSSNFIGLATAQRRRVGLAWGCISRVRSCIGMLGASRSKAPKVLAAPFGSCFPA